MSPLGFRDAKLLILNSLASMKSGRLVNRLILRIEEFMDKERRYPNPQGACSKAVIVQVGVSSL